MRGQIIFVLSNNLYIHVLRTLTGHDIYQIQLLSVKDPPLKSNLNEVHSILASFDTEIFWQSLLQSIVHYLCVNIGGFVRTQNMH
jgi:hypothetical protein